MNVVGVSSVPREVVIRDRICNNRELNNCGVIILYLSDYSLVVSRSANERITEVPDDMILLEDIDQTRGTKYQLIPKDVVYHMARELLGDINDQFIGIFSYDYVDQVIKRSHIKLIINYNTNTNITELGIKIDLI